MSVHKQLVQRYIAQSSLRWLEPTIIGLQIEVLNKALCCTGDDDYSGGGGGDDDHSVWFYSLYCLCSMLFSLVESSWTYLGWKFSYFIILL